MDTEYSVPSIGHPYLIPMPDTRHYDSTGHKRVSLIECWVSNTHIQYSYSIVVTVSPN